jgi:hypothetical protein
VGLSLSSLPLSLAKAKDIITSGINPELMTDDLSVYYFPLYGGLLGI